MSFRCSLPRPARSLSSSASFTTDSEEDFEPRTARSQQLTRQQNSTDGSQGRRAYSHSTPSLVHSNNAFQRGLLESSHASQFDGSSHSIEVNSSALRSAHPPRNHSHGAVASHFLGQHPDIYGGQTWADFLRDSGVENDNRAGARQNSRRSASSNMGSIGSRQSPPLSPDNRSRPTSSRFNLAAYPTSREQSGERTSRGERKRRLTTPESPMRRPSNSRTVEGQGSNENPLVLDATPPLSTRRGSDLGRERRESEGSIVLPSWQPDAEANHCPVCGSQFTFFYRKHHCRKCGRVVCSACSPHRITIPRQFIVHPPSDTFGANIIDLTGDDDSNAISAFGPFRNPGLGGGEEVRVCNPCVPDPNYSPPPQYTLSPQRYSAHNISPTRPAFSSRNASLHGLGSGPLLGHRTSQSVQGGSQTVGHGQAQRIRDPFSDRAVSYNNSTRVADLWPPSQSMQPGHAHSPQPSQYAHQQNPHQRMNSNPNSSARNTGRRSSFVQRFMPPPAPQPAPRRQIAEEDECPICGSELPPKGPNNDEADRIQHVEDCLALHSSSPPHISTNQTSTSLPSQRTRGMSNVASLSGNGEGASSNMMSISARGMVPYKATEKDCVGEDGEQAECVICFEEFEAGDNMGRLVCWCKFHERCIRQWWEKKGRGACPTHQLHD